MDLKLDLSETYYAHTKDYTLYKKITKFKYMFKTDSLSALRHRPKTKAVSKFISIERYEVRRCRCRCHQCPFHTGWFLFSDKVAGHRPYIICNKEKN